jgi:hypothetical protein
MKRINKGIVIGLAILLSGCVNRPTLIAPTTFKTYDDFREGPKGGVDLIWSQKRIHSERALKRKLRKYDSIIYDQIDVVLDKKSQHAVSESDIFEIKAHFLSGLKQLNTGLTVVDSPKENTLRARIALTNLETPNPILAITSSLLPVGLGISTVSKVLTGEHTNVGSASMEILISDATTGEPIIAAIDKKSGNKDFSTMIDSTDDIKDAIDWWLQRLSVSLQKYNATS